jgi:hypothetical protein
VEEVSEPNQKQITLDLSFSESQDVPYGSKMSQSIDNDIRIITLQKSPQTDDHAPANKTQVLEWPQALWIRWIEPPSR